MRDENECRSYVSQIVAQHRRLHAMLRQMRYAIVESVQPDERPSFAEISRILGRLRKELEQHFAQEEAGGCLDEVVSRCPSLSAEAKRIEREHPEILAHIDQLIEKSQALPPTPQNQLAIQQGFDQLYRRLRAHEAAENRLMAQGFGMQVDGDEVDHPLIYDI